MPSTARQLRQPPTIEAIGRVPYFPDALVPITKPKNFILVTLNSLFLISAYKPAS